MRIIAGEHRGRRLLPPAGEQTRPVTDRVKQSIFDVLSPRIEGAIVYDCFAGTGSFGLESLSRGAAHVTFFESHRQTIDLLRKNIESLRVGDRATIVTADFFTHMERATPKKKADLIFLDPPYRYLNERAPELQKAAAAIAANHLATDGVVSFRHDAKDQLSLAALPVLETRDYGSMTIELLGAVPSPSTLGGQQAAAG